MIRIPALACTLLFSLVACSDMIKHLDPGGVSSSIDLVIIIDGTGSMSSSNEIDEVKAGIAQFCDQLSAAVYDVRLAVVMFGYEPELIIDWTTDFQQVKSTCALISVSGAVAGVHENHASSDDPGLEAVRIVLSGASNNSLARTHVGGTGPLAFRDDARKSIFLFTDEPVGLPYYSENRLPGPLSHDPLLEVAEAAGILIDENVATYIMDSLDYPDTAVHYADPGLQVQGADWSGFNGEGTLQGLATAGLGDCLQARLLSAGIISRCVGILDSGNPQVVSHVFMEAVEDSKPR